MSELLFRPTIFKQFSEVAAAHSLKSPAQPADFSMRHGGEEAVLAKNRTQFARELGFEPTHLVFPHLEHSNNVFLLDQSFKPATSDDDRPVGDAVITDRHRWLIGVTVADCAAVLIYDPEHSAVGVAHSGWRGSAKNVVGLTINKFVEEFGSRPGDLYVYVSPTPSRQEYEVEHDTVSINFPHKYSSRKGAGKDWFDNKAVVFDQLTATGIPTHQIELDPRSNVADRSFHSFRREGKAAGRSLVAIGLR